MGHMSHGKVYITYIVYLIWEGVVFLPSYVEPTRKVTTVREKSTGKVIRRTVTDTKSGASKTTTYSSSAGGGQTASSTITAGKGGSTGGFANPANVAAGIDASQQDMTTAGQTTASKQTLSAAKTLAGTEPGTRAHELALQTYAKRRTADIQKTTTAVLEREMKPITADTSQQQIYDEARRLSQKTGIPETELIKVQTEVKMQHEIIEKQKADYYAQLEKEQQEAMADQARKPFTESYYGKVQSVVQEELQTSTPAYLPYINEEARKISPAFTQQPVATQQIITAKAASYQAELAERERTKANLHEEMPSLGFVIKTRDKWVFEDYIERLKIKISDKADTFTTKTYNVVADRLDRFKPSTIKEGIVSKYKDVVPEKSQKFLSERWQAEKDLWRPKIERAKEIYSGAKVTKGGFFESYTSMPTFEQVKFGDKVAYGWQVAPISTLSYKGENISGTREEWKLKAEKSRHDQGEFLRGFIPAAASYPREHPVETALLVASTPALGAVEAYASIKGSQYLLRGYKTIRNVTKTKPREFSKTAQLYVAGGRTAGRVALTATEVGIGTGIAKYQYERVQAAPTFREKGEIVGKIAGEIGTVGLSMKVPGVGRLREIYEARYMTPVEVAASPKYSTAANVKFAQAGGEIALAATRFGVQIEAKRDVPFYLIKNMQQKHIKQVENFFKSEMEYGMDIGYVKGSVGQTVYFEEPVLKEFLSTYELARGGKLQKPESIKLSDLDVASVKEIFPIKGIEEQQFAVAKVIEKKQFTEMTGKVTDGFLPPKKVMQDKPADPGDGAFKVDIKELDEAKNIVGARPPQTTPGGIKVQSPKEQTFRKEVGGYQGFQSEVDLMEASMARNLDLKPFDPFRKAIFKDIKESGGVVTGSTGVGLQLKPGKFRDVSRRDIDEAFSTQAEVEAAIQRQFSIVSEMSKKRFGENIWEVTQKSKHFSIQLKQDLPLAKRVKYEEMFGKELVDIGVRRRKDVTTELEGLKILDYRSVLEDKKAILRFADSVSSKKVAKAKKDVALIEEAEGRILLNNDFKRLGKDTHGFVYNIKQLHLEGQIKYSKHMKFVENTIQGKNTEVTLPLYKDPNFTFKGIQSPEVSGRKTLVMSPDKKSILGELKGERQLLRQSYGISQPRKPSYQFAFTPSRSISPPSTPPSPSVSFFTSQSVSPSKMSSVSMSPSRSPSVSVSMSPRKSLSPSPSPSPSPSISPSFSPSPSISPSISPSLSPSPSVSPSLSPSPSPSPSPSISPPTRTPPPTTPALWLPKKKKLKKKKVPKFVPMKQPKRYAPTLRAVFLGIKAPKGAKKKRLTGLEERGI